MMNESVLYFFQLIRDFLSLYLPKQRGTSKNTIKSYRDALNLLLDFLCMTLQIPLTEISFVVMTKANIMEFLDWLESERGNSVNSRNQRLFAIKSFFKYVAGRDRTLMSKYLEISSIPDAIDRVTKNKGAPGIDKMTYAEVEGYFAKHGKEIWEQVRTGTYKPAPVRRVYIPKPNGKKRPLGIPVVVDRVVQQAIAQVLSLGYEQYFSNNSFGYRPGTGAQHAVDAACTYLDEGFEWVVDLDIEKFFDTVNHDKLIAILRERVNEDNVIKLIRAFLKAGVMEEGLYSVTEEGVPQGGPLSPILSLVYLDKLDKELEKRGLHYCRYADDVCIFVGSKQAADRVLKSISHWIETELHLKVNATKSKVVRPGNSIFLGYTFWKSPKEGWSCKPANDRKQRLKDKLL